MSCVTSSTDGRCEWTGRLMRVVHRVSYSEGSACMMVATTRSSDIWTWYWCSKVRMPVVYDRSDVLGS